MLCINLIPILLILQRSVGSDSQGRVTAANNQRQLPGENKKPYNFLPLHVNTNKSRDLLAASGSASTLATPASSKQAKKQSPGFRDSFGPLFPIIEPLPGLLDSAAAEQSPLAHRQYERGESCVDSSQVMLSMAHQLLHVWTCVCILYISV